MRNLELGLIGNCAFCALVDERAEMVWTCLPRFDGESGVLFTTAVRGKQR